MYKQFFGFKEAPFNLTPDSKFLFLSHRHQEALAALLFGVQERKGFICLTGEIGCGKTTLCRAMLSQLDPQQVKSCVVLNSYLTDLELLKTINEGFALPAQSDSKKALLDELNNYLISEFSQGHNTVLIIDEAQNLRPETLEQIRMISNLETETAKLIQIVLIGQPELRRTLALPELEQLNQRITVRYHITPLDEKEIPDYIRHRLAVAEPQVEVAVSPQAIKLIYHYTRGVPRRINVIGDRSLLVAYIQGTFNIDDKIVQQAVNEVRGEVKGFEPIEQLSEFEKSASRATRLRWLAWLGQGLGYMIVIALGVWLGIFLYSKKSSHEDLARKAFQSEKLVAEKQANPQYPVDGDDVEIAKLPRHKLAEEAGATPKPTAAVTPSPTPVPTPSPTPMLYQNWENDSENVLRVHEDSLSEAAAFINVMRRWNIDVDLDPFRKAAPDDVARFDMLETVKQLNFQAIEAGNLAEALHFDLPVLVHVENAAGISSYGVIASMRGEILELIDPVHGRRMMRRDKLEPQITKTIILFKDTMNLAGLGSGDSGDRVTQLQAWLAKESFFEGQPDGKYGDHTREAVEKLQRSLNLKETGRIDSLTAAAIAARQDPRRPRLDL